MNSNHAIDRGASNRMCARFPAWSICVSFSEAGYQLPTEPGICRGNEDSCGNENKTSRKNFFLWGKNQQVYYFSMKIKMMDP